jgi:hypothetical protein
MRRVVSIGLMAGLMALSAPAVAQRQQEVTATARVAPAFRGVERVAVDGRVWRCEGETCVARVPAEARAQERACARLGVRVDRVLAFDVAGTPLSEEALTRCNRGR